VQDHLEDAGHAISEGIKSAEAAFQSWSAEGIRKATHFFENLF
jgi:hypothetical protein